MRKLVLQGLLFITLLFVIDKPIGWVISELAQKRQFDDRIAELGAGDFEAEIIILGSSRGLNDIDAGLLSDLGGKRAYNLSFSGSNHLFHLSILNMVLKGRQPETVLLTVDHGTSFIPNEKSIYRKDLLYPFSCYSPVFHELAEHSKKVFWLGQLFWMYRENNNLIPALTYLKSGKLAPDITSGIDDHGSILIDGRSPQFDAFGPEKSDRPYQRGEESATLVSSFKAIIDLCREHQIRLFLIIPPMIHQGSSSFDDRLNELVDGQAGIVDLRGLSLTEDHYFDAGHLNRKGAAALTTEMYKRIRDGF